MSRRPNRLTSVNPRRSDPVSVIPSSATSPRPELVAVVFVALIPPARPATSGLRRPGS